MNQNEHQNFRRRLPDWLKVRLGHGDQYHRVRQALAAQGLHTVCGSARCPNLGECWSAGTATFMIMGETCTRNCNFCAVHHGVPEPLRAAEPGHLVDAVLRLGLNYVVVTSVTRDDLSDGGASHFADVIRALHQRIQGLRVEVLIPDFAGNEESLNTVLHADPDVLNHNVETVPSQYSRVRPQADYARSLTLLQRAAAAIGEARTKSGLMLGLGETREELLDVLKDLRSAGVGRLTLGQYLQPTRDHVDVTRFLPPDEFLTLEKIARQMGFLRVASGPLVRSSYHAADMETQ